MDNKRAPRIVYAGDRAIAVKVLRFIAGEGVLPEVLLVTDAKRASHAEELKSLCGHLDGSRILEGSKFSKKEGLDLLSSVRPDYILCIHFPYIVTKEVLAIPSRGVLNLHPAYLPYNRGWHTPTWAIWDGTPYGATLHFMDEGVDTGDIVHQKRITVSPDDTADSLYKRVLDLEFEVFKEAWPSLVKGTYERRPQPGSGGTFHTKTDIERIREFDPAGDRTEIARKLRALTTNSMEEAAYMKIDGRIYRMQVKVSEDMRNDPKKRP
ncbi:MAG: formyltransferase family protein [Candidatus Omnitrophota bacterium]